MFLKLRSQYLKIRTGKCVKCFFLPCCSPCMVECSIHKATSLSICKFALKTCLNCNAKSLTVRQLACCNCCFSLPTRLPLMCFLHLLLVTTFGPLVIDHGTDTAYLHIKFTVELWFLRHCQAVSYPGRNIWTDFKATCYRIREMCAALKTGSLLIMKEYVKWCTRDPLLWISDKLFAVVPRGPLLK